MSKENKKTKKESYEERIQRMAERLKISAEIADEFKKYASNSNSLAILFVKKYSLAAERGLWVDIINKDSDSYEDEKELEFAKVTYTTYPRKTKPRIPNRANYYSESDFRLDCAYETWEAANHDIQTAKNNGEQGETCVIIGSHVGDGEERTYQIDSIKKL